MNKRSISLALAALSAHTVSLARFRAGFDDDRMPLGNNYIGDGSEEGGGDKTAVSDGSSDKAQAKSDIDGAEQVQQTQSADAVPQADSTETGAGEQAKTVGDPAGERQPE